MWETLSLMFMRRTFLSNHRAAGLVEEDLSPFHARLAAIGDRLEPLSRESYARLEQLAEGLSVRARNGEPAESLLIETFALVREVAHRCLSLMPFDEQVLAGIALHDGKLVEMQTGEGKTLAAVLPATLLALGGKCPHILTFNDYLARRDERWMRPVFHFFGLRSGAIQQGLSLDDRRSIYRGDLVYATAKEVGYDVLRAQLVRALSEQALQPLSFAIIDEADSILIDEARVPLVIAGQRAAAASPHQLAALSRQLAPGLHWETDDQGRNVLLTEAGMDWIENTLHCGDLHADENYALLTEINLALHAHVLLKRDVDYIVREGKIELVDAFTGRVVDDRRWPDGLQAALEAKEELQIQPGGQILGSMTLQHVLGLYPRLAGMTATARPAAAELARVYGLRVVPIPPHRPCQRIDLPDLIYTTRAAKQRALIQDIAANHERDRPVLVGTASVAESEALANLLRDAGLACRVLNARNDEEEAEIISNAGIPGAITISTNMAGRGTDIRPGGADERERARVIAAGGLYVIGTGRHESRRIDDQLRGRTGRQGDPGTSRFFVSLEDELMVRYGIQELIPPKWLPVDDDPVRLPMVHREVDRLQRIVEGQNQEIRHTLWRYAALVEQQRKDIHAWRQMILSGEVELSVGQMRHPDHFEELSALAGERAVREVERVITLHHIDTCWAEHLDLVTQLREGIHLVGLGGLDPLHEFQKQIAAAYRELPTRIEDRIAHSMATLEFTEHGFDLQKACIDAPSATWTYLVNDRVLSELQQMLFGQGSSAFAAGAVLMTWPILLLWGVFRWVKRWRALPGL